MMRARKIGLAGLDLELPTIRGVGVRILERPGRWMEEDERRRLLGELREVAARGTRGRPLVYGVLSGRKARWDRAVLTVLRDTGSGRMVGFGAMSLLDVSVRGRRENLLHLGLLVLDPGYRGRGFSRLVYGTSCVLALARRAGRSFWVSNVSQVPAVVGMVAESLEDAWPAPGAQPSAEHRAVAREIMRRHRSVFGVGEEAGFDAERSVVTGAYTGGSDDLKKAWSEIPRHRDAAINAWCRRELDYDRGDDFLQLGRFTPAVARGCVGRFLFESSVVAPTLRDVRALVGARA